MALTILRWTNGLFLCRADPSMYPRCIDDIRFMLNNTNNIYSNKKAIHYYLVYYKLLLLLKCFKHQTMFLAFLFVHKLIIKMFSLYFYFLQFYCKSVTTSYSYDILKLSTSIMTFQYKRHDVFRLKNNISSLQNIKESSLSSKLKLTKHRIDSNEIKVTFHVPLFKFKWKTFVLSVYDSLTSKLRNEFWCSFQYHLQN